MDDRNPDSPLDPPPRLENRYRPDHSVDHPIRPPSFLTRPAEEGAPSTIPEPGIPENFLKKAASRRKVDASITRLGPLSRTRPPRGRAARLLRGA